MQLRTNPYNSSSRVPARRRRPVTTHALAGLVASVDAAMLLAALALAGRLDAVGLAYAVATWAAFAGTSLHQLHLNPRVGDDLPALVARMGLAVVALAVLAPVLGGDAAQVLGAVGRAVPAAVLLVVLGRAGSYAVVRAVRARGLAAEPTLIVGAGTVGAKLAAVLAEHREYGMAPVGFLDSFDGVGLSMPVLGDTHDLLAVVERQQVQRVIVAFGAMNEEAMVQVLRDCDRLPVEVYVVPRFFELGVTPAPCFAEDVWGIPLIRLRRSALRAWSRMVKRAFDVVAAGVLLVLAAPVMAACAIAVRCSSPGPILFRQKRVGRNGQVFEVLKFRTLLSNDDSDTTWSVVDDRRQTRVGAVLRRTSLDELPQLVNVLQGTMSMIGPRPERAHFAGRFGMEVPRYDDRHRVLGGITGWAQVHGLRGDTPIDDRARFDNQYIEHWSLWRDLVIFARTVVQLLTLR
jgi:exopolysaccharide biosynthesis polyprenyl glycosylphosphotransferase